MNRGSTKKQRLEGQQHYDELESDIDKKAGERFHTPPAYRNYTVTDYLRKVGVNVNKEVDAGGTDDKGKTCNVPEQ